LDGPQFDGPMLDTLTIDGPQFEMPVQENLEIENIESKED